jgi:hypothetical protein
VQNAELARALNGGVGFHHAGLGRDDRAIVEALFRSGAIKVLVATSTVAAGVNPRAARHWDSTTARSQAGDRLVEPRPRTAAYLAGRNRHRASHPTTDHYTP